MSKPNIIFFLTFNHCQFYEENSADFSLTNFGPYFEDLSYVVYKDGIPKSISFYVKFYLLY